MILESSDVRVKISTDIDTLQNEILKYVHQHIPITNVKDSEVDADYEVELAEGNELLEINKGRIVMRGKLNKSLFPQDIVVLLSGLYESLYTEKDMFSIHSSSVLNDDEGYLLVGPSSVGKTTTALKLCKDYSFKFFSGDRSIIDSKGILRAGTKPLAFRKRSLYEELGMQQYENFGWEDSIKLTAEELGLESSSKETILSKIYFPRKTSGNLFTEDIPYESKIFRLYKMSCYFEEMHLPVLYGLKRAVPQFLSEDLKKKKLSLVEKIVSDYPMESVTGSLNNMSRYIGDNHGTF